ncbi:hypothetical protein PMI11_01311 [Rhizobium sp. CF142]|nr:hypothetical protein PMI11_01311 [Rhizobium sp. CF142]
MRAAGGNPVAVDGNLDLFSEAETLVVYREFLNPRPVELLGVVAFPGRGHRAATEVCRGHRHPTLQFRLSIFDDVSGGGIRGAPALSTELIAVRPIRKVNFCRPLFGRADRDQDPTTVFRGVFHVAPPVWLVHRISSCLAARCNCRLAIEVGQLKLHANHPLSIDYRSRWLTRRRHWRDGRQFRLPLDIDRRPSPRAARTPRIPDSEFWQQARLCDGAAACARESLSKLQAVASPVHW